MEETNKFFPVIHPGIHTGKIILRAVSGFPGVRYKAGVDEYEACLHMNDFERAKKSIGRKVKFELVAYPHGRDFISDRRIAIIINWNDPGSNKITSQAEQEQQPPRSELADDLSHLFSHI